MKVLWFARGLGIARMGPFSSHVKASEALTGLDGNPIANAYVWPEMAPRGKRKVKP